MRIVILVAMLFASLFVAAEEVTMNPDDESTNSGEGRRHRTPPAREWCSIDVAEQTFSTSLTDVVTYQLLTDGDVPVAVAANPAEFMQLLSSTPGGVYLLRLTTDAGRSYSGTLPL